jgi:hypothetical protein
MYERLTTRPKFVNAAPFAASNLLETSSGGDGIGVVAA